MHSHIHVYEHTFTYAYKINTCTLKIIHNIKIRSASDPWFILCSPIWRAKSATQLWLRVTTNSTQQALSSSSCFIHFKKHGCTEPSSIWPSWPISPYRESHWDIKASRQSSIALCLSVSISPGLWLDKDWLSGDTPHHRTPTPPSWEHYCPWLETIPLDTTLIIEGQLPHPLDRTSVERCFLSWPRPTKNQIPPFFPHHGWKGWLSRLKFYTNSHRQGEVTTWQVEWVPFRGLGHRVCDPLGVPFSPWPVRRSPFPNPHNVTQSTYQSPVVIYHSGAGKGVEIRKTIRNGSSPLLQQWLLANWDIFARKQDAQRHWA